MAQQYQFNLVGSYTSQTKKQFDSLSKFFDSNMAFYISVNKNGLHFITKSKGNVTSNILRLNREFFQTNFEFQEDLVNQNEEIVLKTDWRDFDNIQNLLEIDNEFSIKADESHLIITQILIEDQYMTEKVMKTSLLQQDEDEENGITSLQTCYQNLLAYVHFPDGNVFTVIDQAFRYLKLENIAICFDFVNEHDKKIHIQNQEPEGGLFKVSMSNFTYKKGAKQEFQIMYDNTLFRKALAFINKNTSVELKVDNNQTLYIISQEEHNQTYSETVLCGKFQ